MSELERLIQQYCPNGIEYKKIKDIAKILRGKRLTKDQLSDDGSYPVFHGGLEPLGFYLEKNRNANTVMIINVGASAGTVGFCDKDFWSSDGCFCISQNSHTIPKYLYHTVAVQQQYLMSKVRKAGIPTLDAKVIEDLKIPVPPIEVQSEIVRILDNFTELTAKLTAELTARKKQYNELAYRLLIKNNRSSLYKVKDLCDLSKGKTPIQKAEAGEYPLVVTTSERKSCNTFQYDAAAVCIPLVSSRGHGVASLNHVYYQEGKFALGNILCAVIPKDQNILLAKYLYFYFECTKDYTLVPLMKGGANVAMHIPDIEKLGIYVPDYDTQKSIVSTLEALDEYCNVILPAEIEARQKQYEYYRDKLLTFKEASL